jgi:MoaA/NifB/PqqE/SkfB family radical SAM enzyme
MKKPRRTCGVSIPEDNIFSTMEVPPPITANIALTNKCNLRCEICGSQKTLDLYGRVRQHTELDLLKNIAEAIFPFLITVELNSQGDPLLNPHIEAILSLIHEHKCELKVQTNGTLFSDRIIDLLVSMCGEVNISLDAVGPKFDEVRKGGIWAKAEPGMLRLLANRDPGRLMIGLYPTLTRRTIGEVINVVEWAGKNGADSVTFHRYDALPKSLSFEEAPTQEEVRDARVSLSEWCKQSKYRLNVFFESDRLNEDYFPNRRDKFASLEKREFYRFYRHPSYPLDAEHPSASSIYICDTPNSYVEIGLNGEIGACCRAQEVPLGNATSVEEFAASWFGYNYKIIRQSMKRTSVDNFPLPNCEECIGYHAPKSLAGRKAVSYSEGPSTVRAGGLNLAVKGDFLFEKMYQERGHIYYVESVPPGIDSALFDVLEEETFLKRVESVEEVDPGCYFVRGRRVYFAATDGKDPRFTHSRRNYVFRRKLEESLPT